MEIRALRPHDDRSAFHCGDAALDRFFRHYADQDQFRHAKPAAVDFYAKYGFAAVEVIEGESAARPRPTAMWLSMQTIRTAGGPGR